MKGVHHRIFYVKLNLTQLKSFHLFYNYLLALIHFQIESLNSDFSQIHLLLNKIFHKDYQASHSFNLYLLQSTSYLQSRPRILFLLLINFLLYFKHFIIIYPPLLYLKLSLNLSPAHPLAFSYSFLSLIDFNLPININHSKHYILTHLTFSNIRLILLDLFLKIY